MSAGERVEVEQGRGAHGLAWALGNRSSPAACRWALVPLRVVLGLMFAASGAQKGFGWFGGGGFAGTVALVRDAVGFPLPGLFAVLLIVAELVGGILLVVGVAPRLAALGIAIAMVVALLTVKRGEGYFGTYFQQLILAASVSVMIAGSGALSIMRSGPRAT